MAFPTGQWRIQGRGPEVGPPPLSLDKTEALRAEKIFWGGPPPPPYFLDERASPLSQGLDTALRAIHGA